MKGKKYDPEVKERALALLAVNDSVSKVAKELNLPWSTVDCWKKDALKDADSGDGFVKLREQKKEEFINGAWDIVMRAQRLITKRIDRAEKAEAELDRLLDEVDCLPVTMLSNEERRAIAKRIMELKLDDIGKLGTVMGTMFDKHALALNQPTAIHGGEVVVRKFEEL